MRIICPHCKNALNIVTDSSVTVSGSCPSCGSELPQLEATVQLPAANPLTGRQVGNYELLEIVGQGQFGTVWKARDVRIDRVIALKLPRFGEVDAAMKSQFLHEAKAAASVRHANIVTVLDVGEHDGQLYIASTFVDGRNLQEQLKISRLTYPQICELMITVAECIHQAHEAGIIHRDLKPANILMDAAGTPFVSDFGLAKNQAAEITMTVSGVLLGTPAYMSPEQACGKSHTADRRSDVYSLGVILYELVTGRKPFISRSELLLTQIQTQEPDRPRSVDSNIPRDLETVCLKAMEKAPGNRYQTALDFAEDLNRFAKGLPTLARPVSWLERTWRKACRNPALSTAVLIAVVSLGLVAVMASWKSPSVSVALSAAPDNASTAVAATQADGSPRFPVLAFAAHADGDFHKPPDENGPAVIRSMAYMACLEVGRPETDHYVIRIEAERLDGPSRAGIAVGIHQTSRRPEEYRCLVIYADGEPGEPTILNFEDSIIGRNGIGHQDLMGKRVLERIRIDEGYLRNADLEVEIQDRRIVSVTMNGQRFADRPSLSEVNIANSAACGIVAMGHVTFPGIEIERL